MHIWLPINVFAFLTVAVKGQGPCSCGSVPPTVNEPHTYLKICSPKIIEGFPCDFTACPLNCNYTITLGDAVLSEPYGGISASIQYFDEGDSDAQLLFYDGIDENATLLGCVNSIDQIGYTVPSTTQGNLRVEMKQTNGTVIFYVAFSAAKPGLGPSTPAPNITSTPPPIIPGFACNPAMLQFELSVIMDCSSQVSATDFAAMKTFAGVTLPEYLTILSNSFESKFYSRIMLTLAAPRDNTSNLNYGTPFNPWEYDKKNYMDLVTYAALQYSASSNNSAFAYAMTQTYLNGFNNATAHYLPRQHAARLMIILVGSDVDVHEAGLSNETNGALNTIFNTLHQNNILTLVISLGGSGPWDIVKYKPWQIRNYTSASNVNVPSIFKEIMDNLLCDGDKLCKQDDCGQAYNLTSAGNNTQFVQTNNFDKSNLTAPSRYCNNMACGYTFYNGDGNASCIRITVHSYEIETGYDYLSVYDEMGNERASFTGTAVSNATVFIRSNATINFITDYQQVYRGFNATASLESVGNCTYPNTTKRYVEIDGVVISGET